MTGGCDNDVRDASRARRHRQHAACPVDRKVVGPGVPRRPPRRHSGDVSVEHRDQWNGQPVLCRCGASGFDELGGVVVRLAGPAQLHHRRQATGIAVGFAFLAKMLEGLMVAPALAAAYLVAAPTPLRARLRDVLVAAVAFVVSAGWFVVLTLLWPASSRPYIAGSTDNNFMNLVLGYNGFARVLGRNHPAFTPPTSELG